MYDGIIMREYAIILDEKPHASINQCCYWISKQCFKGAVSWRYVRSRLAKLI